MNPNRVDWLFGFLSASADKFAVLLTSSAFWHDFLYFGIFCGGNNSIPLFSSIPNPVSSNF